MTLRRFPQAPVKTRLGKVCKGEDKTLLRFFRTPNPQLLVARNS